MQKVEPTAPQEDEDLEDKMEVCEETNEGDQSENDTKSEEKTEQQPKRRASHVKKRFRDRNFSLFESLSEVFYCAFQKLHSEIDVLCSLDLFIF